MDYKFSVLANPFGTLYHPWTIGRNLLSLIEPSDRDNDLIVNIDERVVHYDMHSAINAKSKQELIKLIHHHRAAIYQSLLNTHIAFLTFGSAFFFYHKELEYLVGNCHKQDNDLFERGLSPIDLLTQDIVLIVDLLKRFNPAMEIILTVSPVRHLRDGLINNNRSKAHLLAAVHDVVDSQDQVHYFPAYELVMDDLRNYRFYTDDLIHPNSYAIEYIWERFEQSYLEEDTVAIAKKVKKITSFLNHRPFDVKSKSYRASLVKISDQIEELEEEYQLDFVSEYKMIQELRSDS